MYVDARNIERVFTIGAANSFPFVDRKPLCVIDIIYISFFVEHVLEFITVQMMIIKDPTLYNSTNDCY